VISPAGEGTSRCSFFFFFFLLSFPLLFSRDGGPPAQELVAATGLESVAGTMRGCATTNEPSSFFFPFPCPGTTPVPAEGADRDHNRTRRLRPDRLRPAATASFFFLPFPSRQRTDSKQGHRLEDARGTSHKRHFPSLFFFFLSLLSPPVLSGSCWEEGR